MNDNANNKNIVFTDDYGSNNYEKKQLLNWIPSLISLKISELTVEQLRILHYILGYNCSSESPEDLLEELQEYGYSEECSRVLINIFRRDGYLIIKKPY